MNHFSQSGKLDWDSTYEIVLALIERYPDLDLDAVGLNELNQYIVTLPNFVDDPRLANEGILSEILREWYEEVNP
ncbi:MAG: Fe-S cluster assembly protein IscX [Anaerolineae bacterium]|nr:Fe-S cluster assembly protein IscX [Anaerolineae bacterium]